MDFSELKINKSGWKAITDYLNHKDKSALIKVIRTEPETLANSPLLRNFIADIIEGNKTRFKRPKHTCSKRIYQRNCKVLERIAFYIGYGYPIKPSPHTDKTCCKAVADEFSLSPETVETEIYRKYKRFLGLDEDLLLLINGTKLYNSYIAGRKASGATSPPPKCEFVERILQGKPWEWGSYEEE